ncbi:MFS transporter [Leucobacter sp. wl10]|uniref:MFS transporter n=1 Tax=Leucobacter sp. wl10 TaxID=2304677 RepID=UPI0013C2E525|nr:MFS transporter [Leucobacter sp. wl10]
MLRRVQESPLWTARNRVIAAGAKPAPRPRGGSPARVIFAKRWRGLVLFGSAIVFTASAPYYLTTGILPTVFKTSFDLPQNQASLFVIINVIGSAVIAVLCGHLSQHVGRRPVFVWAGAGCLILIPGLYWLMQAAFADAPALILVCSAVMVVLSGAVSAPLIIFLNETFPTEIRSTATAFAWNIGYGLSGLMPTVVTAISARTGNLVNVIVVSAIVIGLALLALLFGAKETRGRMDAEG